MSLSAGLTIDGLFDSLADKIHSLYGDPGTSDGDQRNEYEQYRDDPVGFGNYVLGYSYTPQICEVMESVRDNVVTVAQSATGTGKNHGAASIAEDRIERVAIMEIY